MNTDDLIEELEYAVLGAMALGNDTAFKRVADIKTELKAAIEEMVKDAARLEWAMNNMSQHNYTLFGMHVINIGGIGDISDCRSFVDARMKETP